MNHDCCGKRADLIRRSTQIREEFAFPSPVEVLRAVKVFAGDLYGGNLGLLRGDMANQMFNTCYTCIKLAWQVPRATHTYFAGRLLSCGLSHIRDGLLAKYETFLQCPRRSPSRKSQCWFILMARISGLQQGTMSTLSKTYQVKTLKATVAGAYWLRR